MRTRTAVLILCAAATLGAIVQCGGGSSPTNPPTPVPTASPTPTPPPTGVVLPPGLVCDPTPPPLYGMKVGPFGGSPDRLVLDSKPLVVNVDNYCERVIGVGGRFCDTRKEGDPQRTACDYLAVGQASDTQRWGPTWSWNEKPCDGANFTSCANSPNNQFQVVAKATGRYEACASPLARVDPDGGRCGGCTFANGDCRN